MKKYVCFLVWVMLLMPGLSFTQQSYQGLFSGTPQTDPIIHADGLFKFFVESDFKYRQGQWEQAVTILDNAIAQNPQFAESYLKRATVLSRMGRFTEARQDLKIAYQLNPYLGQFFNPEEQKGKLNLLAFDWKSLNETTVDLDEANQAILVSVHSKKQAGNYVGALSELNRLEKQLEQKDAWFYNLRGTVYLLLSEYELAISDFGEAIEIAPQVADYYFNRGIAQLFTYNRSGACGDLATSDMLGFPRSEDKIKYFCTY